MASWKDQTPVLSYLPFSLMKSQVRYIALSCAPYMSMTSSHNRSQSLPGTKRSLGLNITQLSLRIQGIHFKFLIAKTTYIYHWRPLGMFSHPAFLRTSAVSYFWIVKFFNVSFRQLAEMGTMHMATPDNDSAITQHFTYFNWCLLGSRQVDNKNIKSCLMYRVIKMSCNPY